MKCLLECDKELVNNAEIIYLKYLAVKRYFLNDYNYFKYNGTVKKSFLSGFDNKKEFYDSVKLHNKYGNIKTIEKLFVLNFVKNSNCWMGSLDYKVLTKFESFLQSSQYIFKQQVKSIFTDTEYSYEKYFTSLKEFTHTRVFAMYEDGLIQEEVLIILDILFGDFLEKNYTEHNDFIFEPTYKKIKKYRKFLEVWGDFHILSYEKITKDFLSLKTNNI